MPGLVPNAIASKARIASAHGPDVVAPVHGSPVASEAANGWLVSKSNSWPQIVCLPATGGGHAIGALQPPCRCRCRS